MSREVFDEIAPSWYNFRHWSRFRRELEALAPRWREGKLLNIGCAHGPDFLPFKGRFELYGIDFAKQMLKMAQKYAAKFDLAVSLAMADVRYLPYAEGTFDRAISVATYHHLEGKEERLKALRELGRVLKPGGEAFITVWNRWQPRFWLRRRREIVVPWRTRDRRLERYYYLFSYGGLEKLVKRAGFELLESSPERSYRLPIKFFSRNICLLVRKA